MNSSYILFRRIAGDIANTYSKLEKLTLCMLDHFSITQHSLALLVAVVAKSKSLFNDSSVEIQELTFIIKEVCILNLLINTLVLYLTRTSTWMILFVCQDITSLTRQIAQLQQVS
jgi:hypothetical protein